MFDSYNALAEENLSKAVKLDPGLIVAWQELGECLWKRQDTEGCCGCFEAILHHVQPL